MAAPAVSPNDVQVAGLGKRVTFLESDHHRFLIHDSPTDANLHSYLAEWKKHNVDTVVRACDGSYSTKPLAEAGIDVQELPFADGDPPPAQLIERWLSVVDEKFDKTGAGKNAIAVHCVAGLGRAPVLVALALVEKGMEPLDAISFIRARRRGAINARQLKFLESYVPKKRSKSCCTIM